MHNDFTRLEPTLPRSAAAGPSAPLLKLYRIATTFGDRYVEAPSMAEALSLLSAALLKDHAGPEGAEPLRAELIDARGTIR